MRLAHDELQILIESLDAVGWNASLHPDRETDSGGWDGIPWNGTLPSHHVAVRTPEGRVLDIRGWLDDPRWDAAEPYGWRFDLSAKDRETARRLLDAVDPQDAGL